MLSLWEETAVMPKFNALCGDIKTDVLIIGGGIAGILCAYALSQRGVDYVLVEADTLCGKVTKDTTAKITAQHGLVYAKLLKKFGAVKTQMYAQANVAALKRYRTLCESIDCDFEDKDSFVYSRRGTKPIEDELAALEKIGVKAQYAKSISLPFEVDGAVCFENQAQFNVQKFLSQIAKDLNIYENTRVTELLGTTAKTDKGTIAAKRIIVATHFPFINKHGSYFLKLYQHRSYVAAFENAPDVCGMYVDEDAAGFSLRNYKDLLIINGGAHRTGKKGDAWKGMEHLGASMGAQEKYTWATQDCMTLDAMPYVGNYSKNTPNLYVTCGFNKWGMTTAMAASEILGDMLSGKQNEFETLFSPSRSIFHATAAKNAFEATLGLLTPTPKRCPHLGCALKWNKEEHSWDCPCHGSRFDEEGGLLDNPATGDLKKC